MDRREALKKLGLTFGFLVTVPTTASILQSCKRTQSLSWKPAFFSEEEAHILSNIVDVILPATDNTPSASEVHVPEFIDQYLQEVVSLDEQDRTKEYFSKVTSRIKKDAGKDDALALNKEDVEPIVAGSLKKTDRQEQLILDKIASYVQSKQNGKNPELMDDVAAYALITNLRGLAIWSYKTSKAVGENILAYDPIPGRQDGCISVEEATGGKAWSL